MAAALNDVRFRAGPEVFNALADRSPDGRSFGSQAQHDLERYYDLLARTLRTVALTEAQASLICDVINGTATLDGIASFLWAEVTDGIRLNQLDAKWQVDGAQLVALLQSYSAAQTLAIVDGAERFWARAGNGKATPDDLRAVGLVR